MSGLQPTCLHRQPSPWPSIIRSLYLSTRACSSSSGSPFSLCSSPAPSPSSDSFCSSGNARRRTMGSTSTRSLCPQPPLQQTVLVSTHDQPLLAHSTSCTASGLGCQSVTRLKVRMRARNVSCDQGEKLGGSRVGCGGMFAVLEEAVVRTEATECVDAFRL